MIKVSIAIAFALAACTPPSTANDSGTDDVAATDATGACTSITNAGPTVAKTSHPEPPPTMTGGTIADGMYFLTAMDVYNGMTGSNTHQETWVFNAGHLEVASSESDHPGQMIRASGTYSASGNMLSIHFTCPADMMATSPYTATATQLQMINANDPNEMHTFTKQ